MEADQYSSRMDRRDNNPGSLEGKASFSQQDAKTANVLPAGWDNKARFPAGCKDSANIPSRIECGASIPGRMEFPAEVKVRHAIIPSRIDSKASNSSKMEF